MGCFPRVKVLHTSRQYEGQLYIPEVNFLLALVACVVTLASKTTAIIAEAHGICVVLVMLITTLLLTLVMLLVWRVNAACVALFFAVFAAAESVYLSSVLYRFAHGGYIPVAMSAVLVAVMVLWHYVHVKRYRYELERTVSHESVVRDLLPRCRTVPGVGPFYTDLVQGIPPPPPVFPHLVDKIPSIHAVLLFASVKHLPVPHVDATERFLFRQVASSEAGTGTDSPRVFRCVARYGYRDPLEEARDFAGSLVERLQYYIRDVNLYGVDQQQPGAKVSYPSSRCDSMVARQRSVMMLRQSSAASYYILVVRSGGPAAAAGEGQVHPPLSASERAEQLARARSTGIFAEEMLTPAESFSELSRMGSIGSGLQMMQQQQQAVKISLEERWRGSRSSSGSSSGRWKRGWCTSSGRARWWRGPTRRCARSCSSTTPTPSYATTAGRGRRCSPSPSRSCSRSECPTRSDRHRSPMHLHHACRTSSFCFCLLAHDIYTYEMGGD